MLHPILLDGRPPYMPADSAAASLLLAPVAQRQLISVLADALPLNGQTLSVLCPFEPGPGYASRIRKACPAVRAVTRIEDFSVDEGMDAADWVLFVDSRYGIVDTARVEMMLRDVSRVRGKAIHLVAMARHAGGTSERVELGTDGRVRRIQRYYDAATWPFLDAVVCSLVSASALRRIADPPRSGNLDVLRLSLMMLGVPSRDIQAEGTLFDLHRESDLLRLNERAVLQSRESAEPPISASARIHPTARVLGHVVVHDGAWIDANAVVVGPGVIAPRARIGGNAVVTHCVVGPETDVPPGSVLRSRALFGQFSENPATTAPDTSEPLEMTDAVAEHEGGDSIYLRVKVAVDAVVAAAALVVLSPVLLLIALLIRIDSRGSVFFADLREGRNGQLFPCFKFRTMVTGSHARQHELTTLNDVDGPQFKLEKDPRLTRVGRWLRPASLDELPQLFNIVRGEMSLIGPRPSPFRENQTCVPWRDARLSVRPGITGLWQVCRHDRREGDFHQCIYFDLLYVKHVSPLVDVKIALATILTRGGQSHVSVDRIIPRQQVGALMTPDLRALALRQLPSMYRPDEGVFVFRLRDAGGDLIAEGRSLRYTSIVLIGLATEDPTVSDRVLHGQAAADVCARLIAPVSALDNPGDVALLCWAAHACSVDATVAWSRLEALHPETRPCAVVELAWVLSALAVSSQPRHRTLAQRVAARLMALYNASARVFPHTTTPGAGGRSHVSCFADQVYPILALVQFGHAFGDGAAVRMAVAAANHICERQGPAGQWWWHYDARTGDVIEGYPVYSVHQHAMAPMALRALTRVGGPDFESSIAAGMAWLQAAPEIDGRSLIDPQRQTVWRKVGRREPAKASRYLQALATRLRPGATVPGLGSLFPPGAIDYECRPYEFGWFFYAWSDVPSPAPGSPVS